MNDDLRYQTPDGESPSRFGAFAGCLFVLLLVIWFLTVFIIVAAKAAESYLGGWG